MNLYVLDGKDPSALEDSIRTSVNSKIHNSRVTFSEVSFPLLLANKFILKEKKQEKKKNIIMLSDKNNSILFSFYRSRWRQKSADFSRGETGSR